MYFLFGLLNFYVLLLTRVFFKLCILVFLCVSVISLTVCVSLLCFSLCVCIHKMRSMIMPPLKCVVLCNILSVVVFAFLRSRFWCFIFFGVMDLICAMDCF